MIKKRSRKNAEPAGNPRNRELAEVFAQASAAPLPSMPRPFDYSGPDALARVRIGSAKDARAILALAAAMLRIHGPAPFFDNISTLPVWMADYLAEAFEKIALHGERPDKALGLRGPRGGKKLGMSESSRFIVWVVDCLTGMGHPYPVRQAAELLASVDWPISGRGRRPVDGERVWSEEAVRDVVAAHRQAAETLGE